MAEAKTSPAAPGVGDDFIVQLDARVRKIAEEVFRQRAAELQDNWLSYAQIVELTGLSEWTVSEAVRRGELEADYPRPRCPRVRKSKLREWMERGGSNVPSRRE